MRRRPPISTRTYTLFPYTTLVRSAGMLEIDGDARPDRRLDLADAPVGLIGVFDPVARCIWCLHECSGPPSVPHRRRSEEHTSELQSLMRISYAVFCLKTKRI